MLSEELGDLAAAINQCKRDGLQLGGAQTELLAFHLMDMAMRVETMEGHIVPEALRGTETGNVVPFPTGRVVRSLKPPADSADGDGGGA